MLVVVGVVVFGQQRDREARRQQRGGRGRQWHRGDQTDRSDECRDDFGRDEFAADRVGESGVPEEKISSSGSDAPA